MKTITLSILTVLLLSNKGISQSTILSTGQSGNHPGSTVISDPLVHPQDFLAFHESGSPSSINFRGLDGQAFISRDGGETWKPDGPIVAGHVKTVLFDGHPASPEMDVTLPSGKQYVSYDGARSFWRKDLPAGTGHTLHQFIPSSESNASNTILSGSSSIPQGTPVITSIVPNPGANTITIQWENPIQQQVRISVEDVFGKEVMLLFDGIQPSGESQMKVDGSTLPTGHYVYVIKSEESKATESFVIIR